MVSSGLLSRVALVRTDVSEEPGASFIRVTEIGELGTTQAATSNRRNAAKKYQARHFFDSSVSLALTARSALTFPTVALIIQLKFR
jgi:hypothetical protein